MKILERAMVLSLELIKSIKQTKQPEEPRVAFAFNRGATELVFELNGCSKIDEQLTKYG